MKSFCYAKAILFEWDVALDCRFSQTNEMIVVCIWNLAQSTNIWCMFISPCMPHCHSIKGIYFSHVIQIFRCRFRVHICSNVYSALCVLHCGIVRHGNGNMKCFYMWKSQNSLNSLAVGVELCFFVRWKMWFITSKP